MNLKAAIILPSALFALAGGARSQPTTPFRSCNLVTKQSRDIIVAKCVKTTDDPQGALLMRGSLIKSDMPLTAWPTNSTHRPDIYEIQNLTITLPSDSRI